MIELELIEAFARYAAARGSEYLQQAIIEVTSDQELSSEHRGLLLQALAERRDTVRALERATEDAMINELFRVRESGRVTD